LSSAEFDRSVEPLIDIVVVPREVDELVALQFVNRLFGSTFKLEKFLPWIIFPF
jgi:hypothetical protein